MRKTAIYIIIFIGFIGSLAVISHFGKRAHRRNEILSFFNNQADRNWASKYLGAKIDYCTEKWSDSDDENLASPNKRYTVEFIDSQYDASSAVVHDNNVNKVIMTIPHTSSAASIKWVRNNNYFLVFRPAAMDEDFKTPVIEIGNLKKRRIMFLAEAMLSDCGSRNW